MTEDITKDEEVIQRSIYLPQSELDYLKDNGISIAKFMRQAIDAHKKGEWKYDYNPKTEE